MHVFEYSLVGTKAKKIVHHYFGFEESAQWSALVAVWARPVCAPDGCDGNGARAPPCVCSVVACSIAVREVEGLDVRVHPLVLERPATRPHGGHRGNFTHLHGVPGKIVSHRGAEVVGAVLGMQDGRRVDLLTAYELTTATPVQACVP